MKTYSQHSVVLLLACLLAGTFLGWQQRPRTRQTTSGNIQYTGSCIQSIWGAAILTWLWMHSYQMVPPRWLESFPCTTWLDPELIWFSSGQRRDQIYVGNRPSYPIHLHWECHSPVHHWYHKISVHWQCFLHISYDPFWAVLDDCGWMTHPHLFKSLYVRSDAWCPQGNQFPTQGTRRWLWASGRSVNALVWCNPAR